MLTAYLAANAGGVSAVGFKAKLDSLVEMDGVFGPLRLADNTASASCSGYPCTLTDTAVNFTTGCSGGSCVNEVLALGGFQYTISAVTTTSLTISSGRYGVPAPNGSNLRIRLADSVMFYGQAALYVAMLYDWYYANNGTAAQRTNLQMTAANLCYEAEQDYTYTFYSYSPLNDQFYEWGGWGTAVAAIALYPDVATSGTVPKTAAYHLNFHTDMLFNQVLPIWKLVQLGDGKCSDALHCADGGGMAQDWNNYDANTLTGLDFYWYTLPFIAWANASGTGLNTFFVSQNLWMKNYAYETMYVARPDFTAKN